MQVLYYLSHAPIPEAVDLSETIGQKDIKQYNSSDQMEEAST
jgi:hypothetical protein